MRRRKLNIKGKIDQTNEFSIIPYHTGQRDEPILGAGTYTAVYKILDTYNKINDDPINQYILRIYVRDYNYPEINMFKERKVLDEYKKFNNLLSKIYYFGSIYEPGSDIPLNKSEYPFDYNITKIYNTFSLDDVTYRLKTPISNMKKTLFLINNLIMLDNLQRNRYIHCDYKLANVAWENDETMNVILIDYDITTLQPLVNDNTNFAFDRSGNVQSMSVSSTFPPVYLNNVAAYPFIPHVSIPISYWDKYSIGGLINIIKILDIHFNFDELDIDPKITDGLIPKIWSRDIIYSLRLEDKKYEDIPTYAQLVRLFRWLIDNRHIT